jgi:hypothetical protein
MSQIAGSLVGGEQLRIQEIDGSPVGFPNILKVSNGTLVNNGDGSFTLTTGGGGSTVNYIEEVPAGTIDGVNTVFTISHTPISGTLLLFYNGVKQTGGGVSYTLSGTSITFVIPPEAGQDAATDLTATYSYL